MPVQELTDEHLRGEYKELPRVFTYVRTGKADLKDIPLSYRMGKGHVKFFYNKLLYLVLRFNDLIDEMEARGFNLNEELYNKILNDAMQCPKELLNNWTPTKEALTINRERISLRLKETLKKRRTLL